MKLGVICVKCGKSHLMCIRSVYLEGTRRISDQRTIRLPFHEAVLKTETAVSASGTAVPCCRSALPSASRCNGLGGGMSYACIVAQENFYKETSSVLGSSSAVYKTRNGSVPNGRQLLFFIYK